MPYHTATKRRARVAVTFLLTSWLAACGGGDAPTGTTPIEPPGAVVALSVSPTQAQVEVGATTTLSATPRDARGRAVSGAAVSWQSLDPDLATVSNGVVTGRASGEARVVAAAAGVADTATVIVSAARVMRVVLEPGSLTLRPGTTGQLGAAVRDDAGVPVVGRAIAWTSDAPGVATVSSGLVTAVATGTARIIATSGSIADTAVVTVTQAGGTAGVVNRVTLDVVELRVQPRGTVKLTATAWDAYGVKVTTASVSWRSKDPAIATVSATGLVTGVALGTTRVIAAASGHADTVTVTVAPAPVAKVSVMPTFGPLQPGNTGLLSVTTRDGAGNVLEGRPVTYRSSNTAVATVSATGLVTAVGLGNATLTATSEGVSGTTLVQVVAAPVVVASVTVAPATVTLDPKETRALVATVRDASGATIAAQPVTWSTADPEVATVSESGVVTAVGAGAVKITATAAGKSGSATITVNAPPPPSTSLMVTSQVEAVGVVAGRDGAQFLLPDVLVAGEDEAAGLVPLQGMAPYVLHDAPANSIVESATLTITMDASGVFGDPFGLGALVAERATAIALETATPGAGAVEVTTALQATVTVDVTELVRAARLAGDTEITFRLRFATTQDGDGKTDQLELSAGELKVTYLK